jgi:hypothetical protein
MPSSRGMGYPALHGVSTRPPAHGVTRQTWGHPREGGPEVLGLAHRTVRTPDRSPPRNPDAKMLPTVRGAIRISTAFPADRVGRRALPLAKFEGFAPCIPGTPSRAADWSCTLRTARTVTRPGGGAKRPRVQVLSHPGEGGEISSGLTCEPYGQPRTYRHGFWGGGVGPSRHTGTRPARSISPLADSVSCPRPVTGRTCSARSTRTPPRA